MGQALGKRNRSFAIAIHATKRYRSSRHLRAYPEIQIVLSTSWRLDKPFEQLVRLFSSDIQGRILGVTPRRCRTSMGRCA
ncbi:hypothetical protein KVP09_15385 [Alcaligenaceae bacterium CGII-47]|nr:hypothetical protein [Alcaligenaceae bacterium CGII-47]